MAGPLLVGVDFSACSRAALQHARMVAAAQRKPLVIVHVLTLQEVGSPERLAMRATAAGQAPDEFALARAERTLLEFAGVEPPGSEEQLLTEVGDPADVLLRIAADRKVSAIILGTRGRGRVSHMLLGSVATKVMRQAGRMVIAVHCPRSHHD